MNRQDVLSGSLSLGLAVFVFVKAFELGHGEFSNPGAGFVLLWSSVVLGVLALVLILKGSLGRARAKRLLEPFAGLRWTNALITVAAGILYALLMPALGFIVSTFLLMALLFRLGTTSWWRSLCSAALTVAATYGTFHYLLQVEFPVGILG